MLHCRWPANILNPHSTSMGVPTKFSYAIVNIVGVITLRKCDRLTDEGSGVSQNFKVDSDFRRVDSARHWFLSPPMHCAWWAHMHRFLSVWPWLDQNYWKIIHISKSIALRVMKFKMLNCTYFGLTKSQQIVQCQCPVALLRKRRWADVNVKLHFCK